MRADTNAASTDKRVDRMTPSFNSSVCSVHRAPVVPPLTGLSVVRGAAMPIQKPHISLIRRPLTPVSHGRGQDLAHGRVTQTFLYGREYGFIPQFDSTALGIKRGDGLTQFFCG